MDFDSLFEILHSNKEIWTKYKIFTNIHTNSKNILGLLDTIYEFAHVSFFRDQWNQHKLFHITIGETEETKCAFYFVYTNKKIVEPADFKYNQLVFNEKASKRPKCTNPIIKIIKTALECLFNDLDKLNHANRTVDYYYKYKKYKSLYKSKKARKI